MLNFITQNWKDGLEIFILWVLIYQLYRLFRATRGARILVGLGIIFVVLTLISQLLELVVIEWIITKAIVVIAFALIVIFQPELRNGLARLGSSRFFSLNTSERQALLDLIADCAILLSKKRFGALFAIERNISLEDQIETGVPLDAELSPELALTLFHPKTALHDGGVVIRNERVAAAACIFPVSQKEFEDRSLGLRHRAGFGLSEETDAVTIIISEETGHLSLAADGILERDLEPEELRERLKQIFLSQNEPPEEMDREQLDSEDRSPRGRDRSLVSD